MNRIYAVDVIIKQADELKLAYDKTPTDENKKKWYDKIKEVIPHNKTINYDYENELVKYDWINNEKKNKM